MSYIFNRTSVNNDLNVHHLDLLNNITLRNDEENGGYISPILIYYHVPLEDYKLINTTFEPYEDPGGYTVDIIIN